MATAPPAVRMPEPIPVPRRQVVIRTGFARSRGRDAAQPSDRWQVGTNQSVRNGGAAIWRLLPGSPFPTDQRPNGHHGRAAGIIQLLRIW